MALFLLDLLFLYPSEIILAHCHPEPAGCVTITDQIDLTNNFPNFDDFQVVKTTWREQSLWFTKSKEL